MVTIRTTVDKATYAKLVKERKASGVPSVSALFLKKCDLLDDDIEASEIVKKAKVTISKKASKFRFRLKDLFKKEDWENFSKGARLRSGRLFYTDICAAKDGIRPDGKSSSGHQMYIKS